MESKPPLPVVKTLLVCREMFVDEATKEYILVGPGHEIKVDQIPAIKVVAAYIEVTAGRGEYVPTLQLRDNDEQIIWSHTFDRPFAVHNPLQVFTLHMRNLPLCIPRLGQYEFLLLVNNEEIGRRSLLVKISAHPSLP